MEDKIYHSEDTFSFLEVQFLDIRRQLKEIFIKIQLFSTLVSLLIENFHILVGRSELFLNCQRGDGNLAVARLEWDNQLDSGLGFSAVFRVLGPGEKQRHRFSVIGFMYYNGKDRD